MKNKPSYPTSWRSHKRGLLVLGSAECERTEAFLPKTRPSSDLQSWCLNKAVVGNHMVSLAGTALDGQESLCWLLPKRTGSQSNANLLANGQEGGRLVR